MLKICPNCGSQLQRLDFDPSGVKVPVFGSPWSFSGPSLKCPACAVNLRVSLTPTGYLSALLLVVTIVLSLVFVSRYPAFQNSVAAVVGFFAVAIALVLCYVKWGYAYKAYQSRKIGL
jgi:hypothetical protein